MTKEDTNEPLDIMLVLGYKNRKIETILKENKLSVKSVDSPVDIKDVDNVLNGQKPLITIVGPNYFRKSITENDQLIINHINKHYLANYKAIRLVLAYDRNDNEVTFDNCSSLEKHVKRLIFPENTSGDNYNKEVIKQLTKASRELGVELGKKE